MSGFGTPGAAARPKVVAAVDFGTHGTGFAWSVVTPLNDDPQSRRITFYSRFPEHRVDYPKNLTALLVDAEGTTVAWGHKARKQWSEASDAGRTDGLGYAYAFKMALKDDGGPVDMPTTGGIVDLGDRGRVRELITAYLREIRELAVAQVKDAGYAEREIRWCITVPAIWDDEDRAAMRRAAVEAGFPDDPERLLPSIEPEAAALYCYLRMADLTDGTGLRDRLQLNVDGFRFMVVDCGGGTVDITAYETSSDAAELIALREIGVATGGRLGSEYVNQAFREQALGKRLGPELLKRLEREHSGDLLELSEQWERAQTTAEVEWDEDGTPHIMDTVRIDLPVTVWQLLEEGTRARLTEEAGGRPQRLVLAPEEVEVLLDSVVEGILDKVEEQLAAIRRTSGEAAGAGATGSETLVLVGGFAKSQWLRERMHRHFGSRHRILVPPDPALAVLEGATHFAYNPRVFLSRQAKYTYGFETSKLFEESVDSPMRMFRDDDGDILCVGRFAVAVRRLDSVRVKDAFPFTILPTREDQTQIELRIHRTVKAEPRYVDEDGCEEIGRLTVDIGETVGRPLRERPIRLLFYFGRSEIEVEAFDPATGGSHKVRVDFDRM
ncbi:Hsp70 family protein [Streptomyces sp. NPDC008238]